MKLIRTFLQRSKVTGTILPVFDWNDKGYDVEGFKNNDNDYDNDHIQKYATSTDTSLTFFSSASLLSDILLVLCKRKIILGS